MELRPHRRDSQRGNSLLLALIVMSALAALGSLTVVSTQSSLKTTTNDRAQAIALYAAESGAAVAMDFLHRNFHHDPVAPTKPGWGDYIVANNANVASVPTALIPTNGKGPGQNPFGVDQQASYDIQLYNNRSDPGYATGDDLDGRLIIRSTGHGPQGSLAILEWEVQRIDHFLEAGEPVPQRTDVDWFRFPTVNPPTFIPAFPWTAFPPPPPLVDPNPPGGPPTGRYGTVLVGWHIVSL
jgi:hypothetical protein